jgi:type VI secretion system lysozyme-like protein
MNQQRLLKRISTWQQGKQATHHVTSLAESILLDIENILNCQQGNVLIHEEMGLKNLQGHFHSHSAPDLQGLGAEISAQISEFETRLKNVSVSLDEDNQDFTHFIWRLNATTADNYDSLSISAHIKINANGLVTIESAM